MQIAEFMMATPTQIIRRFTEAAPVDVHRMAAALGLKVEAEPLDKSISGKIVKDADRPRYTITLNANHHPRRQRFTLAHEIGHYVLHRDLIGDGIIDDAMYRSRQSDRVERQANSYAASLLMPAPLVRDFAKTSDQLSETALHFGVSEEVARIRLEELGLREPARFADMPAPRSEEEYLND